MPDPPYAQLYGHSRHSCCGVCQQSSIGSETPTIPKQFYSMFPKNEVQRKICQLTLSVPDDFFKKL